jgi:hypothetical protein
MRHDRLGRRRGPGQSRGLRPLHPRLPRRFISKAVRIAMEERDWTRFEALVDRTARAAPTRAQACGAVISRLVDYAAATPEPSPVAWQDWERRKTLRLLLLSN